jgi:hypothetical protein
MLGTFADTARILQQRFQLSLKYLQVFSLVPALLPTFLASLRTPNAASNTSGVGRPPRPCPPADGSAGALEGLTRRLVSLGQSKTTGAAKAENAGSIERRRADANRAQEAWQLEQIGPRVLSNHAVRVVKPPAAAPSLHKWLRPSPPRAIQALTVFVRT